MTGKIITHQRPTDENAPAVRTFASVVESLRISAAAKRELLTLHQRELDAERAAAEARCVAPEIAAELRDLVRGVAEIAYAEAVRDAAGELQRYGTVAERAAEAAASKARVALTMAHRRVPRTLLNSMVDGVYGRVEEMRERDRLPSYSPDRIGPCGTGPSPLAAAIVRHRESGMTVTVMSPESDDEVRW